MIGSEWFSIVVHLCTASTLVCVALAFVRMLKGPSLPDRVVALDFMTVLLVVLIALLMMRTGQTVYMFSAIVAALISFLSTVAFAYYLERRHKQ